MIFETTFLKFKIKEGENYNTVHVFDFDKNSFSKPKNNIVFKAKVFNQSIEDIAHILRVVLNKQTYHSSSSIHKVFIDHIKDFEGTITWNKSGHAKEWFRIFDGRKHTNPNLDIPSFKTYDKYNNLLFEQYFVNGKEFRDSNLGPVCRTFKYFRKQCHYRREVFITDSEKIVKEFILTSNKKDFYLEKESFYKKDCKYYNNYELHREYGHAMTNYREDGTKQGYYYLDGKNKYSNVEIPEDISVREFFQNLEIIN